MKKYVRGEKEMQRKVVYALALMLLTTGLTMFALGTHSVRAATLVGDLNGDGKVSLADLVLMANHYGQTGAGWIDHPTTVDTINNFVYCTTDHFSGIGIHSW